MIFILPSMGVIFLFIGILIFVLLFINNSAGKSNSLFEHFIRDDMIYHPHFPRHLKDRRDHQLSGEQDEDSERENFYYREGIHRELERKKQLESVSSAYIISMSFSLFLYIIGGIIVLWYFRETWHILDGQKLIFLIFYILGFILFIFGIIYGANVNKFGEHSALGYFPKYFSMRENPAYERETGRLSDEYRFITSTNMGKERYLQTAKYLFIFAFFNIFVLALILVMHYYTN